METLPFLPSEDRLKIYNHILSGCTHLYSKGKIQFHKVEEVLKILIPLTQNDPFFLAHLTSYAISKTKNKDLQVLLAYISSLSSADGMPFSPGSEYKKPNLRYISAAAVHSLDPKLAFRVLEIASKKYSIEGFKLYSRHFPTSLRTAFKKYIKYRENNIKGMEGVKKSGLAGVMKDMYRFLHINPSEEAAKILRWNQKDKKIVFEKPLIDFESLNDLEIAEKIRKEKLKALFILGNLKKKISPVIAVALLEQATGDQALILYSLFKDAGLLNDPEVLKIYNEKVATAKTALDRLDRIKAIGEDVLIKEQLGKIRSENNKKEMSGVGKIYLHLDDSGSMQGIRDFAIKNGSIIAECVNNPKENFNWGIFGSRGQDMPIPEEFVRDAFAAILYQFRDGGSTYAFALYPEARKKGAEIDIFVSDQAVDGNLSVQIKNYHLTNPNIPKPKACVVIDFSPAYGQKGIKEAYEENGIPVSIIKPEALTESALVVQTIKAAIQGPTAIVEEIMSTKLLELPKYYYSL